MNGKKKRTELQKNVGHYMHDGSIRRKGEKGAEKVFEEIMAKEFPLIPPGSSRNSK